MIKDALRLTRLARHILRRVRQGERDADAWREAFHDIILILYGLLSGEISSEQVKSLFEKVPENLMTDDDKTNKISVNSLDKSPKFDKIKSGNPHTDGGAGSGNHGHKGVPGRQGGSLPRVASGVISAAIKNGGISTRLDKKKQSKHRKGSKKYNDAVAKGDKVSYFTIDDSEIQKIIIKKAGTGTGYGRNGQYKEVIDTGKNIAVHASMSGKESVSSRITIHYGKNGCHAVPASPKKN